MSTLNGVLKYYLEVFLKTIIAQLKLLTNKTLFWPTESYRFEETDALAVHQVVASGKLNHSSGHHVYGLEEEFAAYVGTKYALATDSGTSALQLAVKAVGIKPGDEVIVPGYTFVASAQAVLLNGGIPIFADIDQTFTISPSSIEEKINSKTKAILVVHMFGNVCQMKKIKNIARKNGLKIIEDCAQAIGATYQGQQVGAIGDVGCFSFNEKKALSTGQGGMLTTSNRKIFQLARASRHTGETPSSRGIDVTIVGGTHFMTEMQAVLARSILKKLDKLNRLRQQNFATFKKKIEPLINHDMVRLYQVTKNSQPSYSRVVLTVNFKKLAISRQDMLNFFQKKGVPLQTFYPTPLYKYSLFRKQRDSINNKFPFKTNSPKYKNLSYAEDFCERQVGFEFSPYLTDQHFELFVKTWLELENKQ